MEEPQTEITKGVSVSFALPDQSPLAVQDLKTIPRSAKKKAKNKKEKITIGQVKATDEGLEGFVDWLNPPVGDLAKGRGEDMSSLAARFTAWMCKCTAST